MPGQVLNSTEPHWHSALNPPNRSFTTLLNKPKPLCARYSFSLKLGAHKRVHHCLASDARSSLRPVSRVSSRRKLLAQYANTWKMSWSTLREVQTLTRHVTVLH